MPTTAGSRSRAAMTRMTAPDHGRTKFTALSSEDHIVPRAHQHIGAAQSTAHRGNLHAVTGRGDELRRWRKPEKHARSAQGRAEQVHHRDRPRHADGRAVPALLDSRHARRGTAGERMPAGARQDPVRAAAGLARHARPARADRRVLRPSRRLALVRPQRAGRVALPLPRLEIRPHRPVHRGALGAGRERLLQARSSSSPIR